MKAKAKMQLLNAAGEPDESVKPLPANIRIPFGSDDWVELNVVNGILRVFGSRPLTVTSVDSDTNALDIGLGGPTRR